MKIWIVVAAWAALAASSVAAAAAPEGCKLVQLEQWTVRLERNQPLVDGEINGNKVGILLDTGSPRSVITRSAALRLGLAREEVKGAGEHTEAVYLDELKIGVAVRKGLHVLVAGRHDFGAGASLILAGDFFSLFEVEFDLANQAVRLFQSKDCASAPLAYWARGGAGEVALEPNLKIIFPVQINGRRLRAYLDSGATASILSSAQAKELGVTSAEAVAGKCPARLGTEPLRYWSAQFDSFAIGNETIRNPKLRLAELWGDPGLPQMILGVDFLRSHRVLVAHSQRKMYFTYAGGTVFPPPSPQDCEAPR